jgi:hypothetical protein
MKKINYQKLSLYTISALFVFLFLTLVMGNEVFIGKAALAIQGYNVLNVADEDLREFEACLESTYLGYPVPTYQNQDKYCACKIEMLNEMDVDEAKKACNVYISRRGKYVSDYLPDTKKCGDQNNVNRKNKVMIDYQFSNGNVKTYVLHKCDVACVEEENDCRENICRETDKGYNVFKFGKIQGMNFNLKSFDAEDECISSSKVKEYYCEDGFLQSNVERCDFGCVEGECRQEVCRDTDNGRNIYIRGTASSGTSGEYNVKTIRTDTCDDSRTLKEYYCGQSGLVGYTTMECQSGCEEGRCI